MRRAALPLALLAIPLAGCGSGGKQATTTAAAAATPTSKVTIHDFAFGPKAARVKLGGSITFTNTDTAPHTATETSGPASFDTDTLKQGQSKTITFTKPGTYQYVCDFHTFMHGSVVVTP